MTTVKRRYSSGFRKLIAWQEAKKLAVKIDSVTENFPRKGWHLKDQMNRAASSAKAQIAEGSAMSTAAHRYSYYDRARGSVAEVDSFVEFCFELKLITQEQFEDLVDHCARLSYLITKLMGK